MPALTTEQRVPVPAGLVVLGLCATSVGALLADLFGIASMATFFAFFTVPALVLLGVVGTLRTPLLGELPERVRIGALAGVAGTIGYDVFRIPFAIAGMRAFAPIDSYGLLIADASMSSPATDALGWLFHLSNGVTFGIAYAVIAARRGWAYGVAWGVMLETAAFLSPFTARYGLTGKWWPITVALLAHVAYGLPVGRIVQRFDAVAAWMRDLGRATVAGVLAVVVVGVLVWHRPWITPEPIAQAQDLHDQVGRATAVVQTDRFRPEWLRIEPAGCVQIVSRSDESFTTDWGDVPAGETSDLCFDDPGVYRVKLGDRAYSGGFVYVDDVARVE